MSSEVITLLFWGLNKLKAVLISSTVGLTRPTRLEALAFLPFVFAFFVLALLLAGTFSEGSLLA